MRENSVLKRRIIQYLDFKGVKKSKFYEDTGISNGVLSQNNGLSEDSLMRFLNFYSEVNSNWLLTGEGSMLKKTTSKEDHLLDKKIESSFTLPKLPIEAMAGVFSGDIQVMEYECEQYVVPMFQNADFLIPIMGDSMYPTYNNGDVIACKKLSSWSFFQFGKVYVLYTSQGVIVKRILEGKNPESILIVSDNKESYPPFELNKTEILGVALVIGGIWLE